MNMNKMITLAAVAASAMAVANAGEPSIIVNSAAQRWPWNNKIDVTYTVTNGQNRAAGLYCGVEFTITDGGRSHVLHGYTVGASAEGDADGTTHSVALTAPSGIRSANCTISATLFTTNVPSGNDYMIVNLANGDIYYEGLMDTQDASNDRYNTNAVYKTTKMVLRKVPKWADRAELPNAAVLASLDGYPTGDDKNYPTTNSRKDWPTAKDYYIGIFMVTQKQYTNLGLSNPSQMTRKKADDTDDTVDHRPVEFVNWRGLRGSIDSTARVSPVTTLSGYFFQRLNFKTGLYFDLPTEVMFEIAQRAGATTVYSWSDDQEKVPDYCVCKSNYGGTVQNKPGNYTCAVGSKLPNNWGLYDTAGNVWEWCRDKNSTQNDPATGNLADLKDAFTPSSTGSYYIGRGFAVASSATTDEGFRASYRYSGSSNSGWNRGFRVSHVVED